jgi:hypothetical protein
VDGKVEPHRLPGPVTGHFAVDTPSGGDRLDDRHAAPVLVAGPERVGGDRRFVGDPVTHAQPDPEAVQLQTDPGDPAAVDDTVGDQFAGDQFEVVRQRLTRRGRQQFAQRLAYPGPTFRRDRRVGAG